MGNQTESIVVQDTRTYILDDKRVKKRGETETCGYGLGVIGAQIGNHQLKQQGVDPISLLGYKNFVQTKKKTRYGLKTALPAE